MAATCNAVVYQFPVAAVTNSHICRGLTQHKLITLQFWRTGVHNGADSLKSKLSAGLCTFWGEPISFSSPAPRSCLHPVAHGLSSNSITMTSASTITSPPQPSCLPRIRMLVINCTHLDNPGSSQDPALNRICKVSFTK